ncbi:MAG: beta-ketoacyl synthase N-terminal-like domain-containing protein [Myxococcota bacterium]
MTTTPAATQETLRRALMALKEARTRLERIEHARREPIAIVGMSCRFPGGSHSPQAYWSLLTEGRQGVREVPRDRWPNEQFYDDDPARPGKMRFREAGFIDEPDKFDPAFFEISPREASHMDPQQRMLLQVAWEAIDDAGISAEVLRGSQTGVWAGVNSNDYLQLQTLDPTSIDTYTITGGAGSIVANRLSYLLDLRGPSMAVDTACSTALVAVHLACQSLRTAECRTAIAGAVNLILSPLSTMAHARGMPMAGDMRCKTFDARADGYVRGEGCGVVVLKRLSDAIADGDEIWATIRGTAINQDGRTNGLTAPSGLAQQEVIRQALASGGVDPASIGFIEAHGTGTALGDPIEVEALQEVYGPTDGRRCALGSVKTNFGHLESAAGIAGLIKVALSLHHQQIPAVLNFEQLNPHIDLDHEHFMIPTALTEWSQGPRLGAVSSFGAGGTNAHVVLEEAPAPAASSTAAAEQADPSLSAGEDPSTGHLVMVSARSETGLRANAAALAQWLEQRPSAEGLADVAFTSGRRRTIHEHRLVIDARDPEALRTTLQGVIDQQDPDGACSGFAPLGVRRRLVFVCSGHGSQWSGMAHDLLTSQPAFRETIERCHAAIAKFTDWSLVDQLRPDAPVSKRFDVVQPTLWAIEVALAAQWEAWGVRPDLLIGHSFGEVAAAAIGGALTLEDAARVVCLRSRLMEPLVGRGRMMLIARPAAEVEALIEPWSRQASVAVVNGPGNTAISGDREAIEQIEAKLSGSDLFVRRIKADIAAHSPQMEPLREELVKELADLQPQTPRIPMLSTVDLELKESASLDATYWGRNLREPVRFGPATERALSLGHDLFVELSPHAILSTAIEQTIAHSSAEASERAVVLPSMLRDRPGQTTMRAAWGGLWAHGHSIEPLALVPEKGRVVRLPSYRWSNRSYWFTEDRWAPVLAVGSEKADAGPRNALREACSTLRWVDRRPTAGGPSGGPTGAWWVLGEASERMAALQSVLESRGIGFRRLEGGALPPASDAAWTEQSPTHILDLRGLRGPKTGTTAATEAVTGMLTVLRHLHKVATASPRLWVVTAGAWDDEQADAIAAAQWGLGRTIAIEQPECFGGMIDLDGASALPAERAAALVEALLVEDGEDQLRLGEDGRVQVPRIEGTPELALAAEGLAGTEHACTLVVGPDSRALRQVLDALAQWGHGHRLWLDEGAGGGADQPEGVTRVTTSGLAEALAAEARAGRPLRTVLRVGAGWQACAMAELDSDRIAAAMAHDAAAVEALLVAIDEHPVEQLVLVGSVAASWGSTGMGHVGAAAAYVDALARCRRANGRACTVIECTPWADGDMVDGETLHRGALMGAEPLDPALALAAVRRAVTGEISPVTVAVVDWSRLRPAYESRRRRPFLGALGRQSAASVDEGSLLAHLRELEPSLRREHLVDTLTGIIATLLRHEPESVEPGTGFFALGMDSLMAVELRRRLQVALAVTIPASVVFEYPTIRRLAVYLLEATSLGEDEPADESSPQGSGEDEERWSTMLADAEQMSEQELLAELQSELE